MDGLFGFLGRRVIELIAGVILNGTSSSLFKQRRKRLLGKSKGSNTEKKDKAMVFFFTKGRMAIPPLKRMRECDLSWVVRRAKEER